MAPLLPVLTVLPPALVFPPVAVPDAVLLLFRHPSEGSSSDTSYVVALHVCFMACFSAAVRAGKSLVPHMQYAAAPCHLPVKDLSFSLDPEMEAPVFLNRSITVRPSQARSELAARSAQATVDNVASMMGADSKLATMEKTSAAVDESVEYATTAWEKE